MRASLIINSFEFGDYIAEGGIKVTKDERVSKSFITANGEKWQKSITKMVLEVELNDMFDDMYKQLCTHFTPNPAVVKYTDFETGTLYSGTFYISAPEYTVTKSISTLTYLEGLSITLEEK